MVQCTVQERFYRQSQLFVCYFHFHRRVDNMNYFLRRWLLVIQCVYLSSISAPAAVLGAAQLESGGQSAAGGNPVPGRVRLESGASQRWGRDKKVSINTTDNRIDATSSLILDGGELHLDEGQLAVDGTLEVQSGSRLCVRRGKLTGNGRIKINKGGTLELASDTPPIISEIARYRGGLNVMNSGVIYGQGIIDGDLTLASDGSITLAKQPVTTTSTATLPPAVFTTENQAALPPVQAIGPDPTLIVVVGSMSASSGLVTETIMPTGYGRLWVTKTVTIDRATLNIVLKVVPDTPPFTFPLAGRQFDMIVAARVALINNFKPVPPSDGNSNLHFVGDRVSNNPFMPGYQAYLLTTHLSTQ
jgi:hypothetical protein